MRFIDESDNWNLFKLGEVLDKKGYIRGPFGSALKRGEMKKEGIPVYEQQHAIYNNRIFRYYIDNDKFQELKRFQVFPNDLIVSCSGTIGKTSLITNNDEKGIISQALLILRSNPNIINPKFLKYFLETNSGYNSLISSAGGSSQVNIAKKQIILDIPLLVPNLETQSKIISFLDLINNKIELLEEKHKYYQDFKKYLMQKLFAQELRFNFNDEWRIMRLNEITFYQEGPGVRNYQYTKEGVKLLNVGNFVNNALELDNTDKYISNEEAYGKYKHFLVDEGDLLIACSGIKAEYFDEKIAFAENKHLPLCMNTSTMRFKSLDENTLNLRYLKYYFQTQSFKKQVFQVMTGSAQFNFGPTHLKYFKIPIPCLDEQIKIYQMFESIDIKISNIYEEIIKIKKFKKGLLQQMFVVQLILSLLQNKKHI